MTTNAIITLSAVDTLNINIEKCRTGNTQIIVCRLSILLCPYSVKTEVQSSII
jgi:hypothetical protein